ncbi:MAG: mycothiol conjugate amidase Mca [Microbacteriaceae bacterium]
MTLRLLAVHAHPDDESSKGAATYARYVSSGAAVTVVSCTGGERGDVQNPHLREMAMAERDIAGLRFREMAAARDVLGIDHRWLGYHDSGLPGEGEEVGPNSFASIPLETSGEVLVRIIRELRPHVLVTYNENGGYPHPDHIRTHEISMWAYAAAADATLFPDAGPAWQISKVYYDQIFSGPRLVAVHALLAEREPDHPLVASLESMKSWMLERPVSITTQIFVADHFDARDSALRAHASQVSPDSSFFFWPNDVNRLAWPWEDFQLALSLVESDLPESDLFAGIEDEETL